MKLWYFEEMFKFFIDDKFFIFCKGKYNVCIVEFISDE